MKSDKTLIRSSKMIRPKNEKPEFAGVSLEARALAFPFARRLVAALPVLDAVYGDEPPQQGQPTWSIGGASALALRLDHRNFDELTIFAPGHRPDAFLPPLNPAAENLIGDGGWFSDYVRFKSRKAKFLIHTAPSCTATPFTIETFRQRQVAVDTIEEVLVKRFRHRADDLDENDAFDMAAAWKFGGKALAVTVGASVQDLHTEISRCIDCLDHVTPSSANVYVWKRKSFWTGNWDVIRRHAWAFIDAMEVGSDPDREYAGEWRHTPTL